MSEVGGRGDSEEILATYNRILVHVMSDDIHV